MPTRSWSPRFRKAGRAHANKALQKEVAARQQMEQTLRLSEERYHDIFENAGVGLFQTTLDGRILSVNATMARLYGYASPEEMIALIGDDLAHRAYVNAEDRAVFQQRLVADGVMREFEEQNYRKDGSVIWVRLNARAVRDASGKFLYAEGFLEDITERKQAEAALRASEKRFRDVAFSSCDWVWEVDAQGRYTYSSQRATEVLGYDSVEILGKTPFDFMPPQEAARVGVIFEKLGANKEPIVDLENVNLRKDGREVHLLTNGVPILGPEGELLGYRGVDKDITGRKQMEKSLSASEAKIRSLLETAPLAIYECDVNGRITVANEAYSVITGYSREEILNMAIWDFQAEGPGKQTLPAYLQSLVHDQPPPTPYQTQNITKDGRCIEVQVDWTYKRSAAGAVSGFVCVLSDITGRVRAEQERQKAEAEIRRFNADLERHVEARTAELSARTAELGQVNAALTQALRVKNEFLSIMSHELRTPLTAVLGLAETLQMGVFGLLTQEFGKHKVILSSIVSKRRTRLY